MQILLKALMTLPNADFIMCRCLIDDANVSLIVRVTFKIWSKCDHLNELASNMIVFY